MEVRASAHRHAGWVAVLALLVGAGLLIMHAGLPGSSHAPISGLDHGPISTLDQPVADGGHAGSHSSCDGDGCSSHTAMTLVCTVLLAAAGGSVAVRLWRLRLHLARASDLRSLVVGRAWDAVPRSALKPPDLHALQVMRC